MWTLLTHFLGTRWASWNIGVFLCIRCGGLHRALGTHISKVKSVTLDKWTDEQVEVSGFVAVIKTILLLDTFSSQLKVKETPL